jgi:hypothetical protein
LAVVEAQPVAANAVPRVATPARANICKGHVAAWYEAPALRCSLTMGRPETGFGLEFTALCCHISSVAGLSVF